MAWKATQTLSLHIPIQYLNNESVGFSGLEWNIQLSD
jgi:hypothetical protein